MNLKKINLIIIITFVLFNFFIINTSLAQSTAVIGGLKNTGQNAEYPVDTSGAPKQEFAQAFVNYINGFFGLISLLFLILILYGGYLWMNARGKEDQVERAKKIMIEATIGLAIIISARLIVELALTYIGKAAYPG